MHALLSSTTMISLAVGIGVLAVAWLILDWFSGPQGRTEQRLDELRDPRKRREREAVMGSASSTVSRVLARTTPALAKPLQPKNEREFSRLRERLMHAGFRGEAAPTMFLGLKFFSLLVGLVIGGGGLVFFGLGMQTLIRSTFVACIMFFVPDLILAWIAKRRKEQIFLSLPDALDLIVVCVEAGLGLDQAMRKVAEEMKKSYRIIANEFGLCNMQLQMGRSRAAALQELGARNGVDDLRSLAAILIQADKFGSSVAQALRVQSDSMRTRRRQIAEEKAAKTAVQLIFPLVLFIFPGIFVVLVGPAGIAMYREMFTTLSNAS
jgi:tight adherence protein C